MRITESMLSSSYLTDLNRNLTKISRYQEQLSTNKRINRPSDDPVGVIASLSVRTSMRELDQYNRNVDDAQGWLTSSESAVMDINQVVSRAYELAMQSASGTQGTSEKRTIATELTQLRDYLIELGNTRLGDKYIFGGFNTASPPFTKVAGKVQYQSTDLSTAPDAAIDILQDQDVRYEINNGTQINVGLNGVDLMGRGQDNMFAIIDGLINDLNNDAETSTLVEYSARLQDKQNDVLTLAADVGGRSNRLSLLSSRFADDEFNYETLQSSIEDIDTAEIITKLKMAETVYEAALSLGSRVILPNLTDFLR